MTAVHFTTKGIIYHVSLTQSMKCEDRNLHYSCHGPYDIVYLRFECFITFLYILCGMLKFFKYKICVLRIMEKSTRHHLFPMENSKNLKIAEHF